MAVSAPSWGFAGSRGRFCSAGMAPGEGSVRLGWLQGKVVFCWDGSGTAALSSFRLADKRALLDKGMQRKKGPGHPRDTSLQG